MSNHSFPNDIERLMNLMNSNLDSETRSRAITLARNQLAALFQQYQPSKQDLLNNYFTSLRNYPNDRNRRADNDFYLELAVAARFHNLKDPHLSLKMGPH